MKELQALDCLSALAHETRLAVFRLLVRMGPDGVAAGAIAQRLSIPPPTLSFHLKELERAGLLLPTRQSRQILYAANFPTMRALLDFITMDCCQGDPGICGTQPPAALCQPATQCAEPADA